MRTTFPLLLISALFMGANPGSAADSWPQWRGADQTGVATGDAYPLHWSEGQGVAWKLEIPGLGGSTPVVHDNVAYLTTGDQGANKLLAVDLSSGEIKWQVKLGEDRGNKHAKGSGSNPSAVVDGDSIYAYFRSGDLACVNADGEIVWQLNLQDKYDADELWWDLGNSPLLTDKAIVVVSMQTEPSPSYLVALDKQTGDVIWKADRELGAPKEAAQSYTTPVGVTVGGEPAIAVMGADHLTLHHAQSGDLIANLGGFNPENNQFNRSIASPVAAGQVIVCPYSRGSTVTGIDLEKLASGEGEQAIVWRREGLGSDVPTPAIEQDHVYLVNDGKGGGSRRVQCLDLKSGETVWEVPMPRSRLTFSSSPLVAGNHLYVTREDATTFVIGPLDQSQPEIVSTNEFDDNAQFTVASPVPVDDDLLIRSRHHLYRVTGQ